MAHICQCLFDRLSLGLKAKSTESCIAATNIRLFIINFYSVVFCACLRNGREKIKEEEKKTQQQKREEERETDAQGNVKIGQTISDAAVAVAQIHKFYTCCYCCCRRCRCPIYLSIMRCLCVLLCLSVLLLSIHFEYLHVFHHTSIVAAKNAKKKRKQCCLPRYLPRKQAILPVAKTASSVNNLAFFGGFLK